MSRNTSLLLSSITQRTRHLGRQMRRCSLILFILCPIDYGLALSDDAGHGIATPLPANRIVSLAPHITELLFAAGAGQKVVGVVQHSDFPAPAKDITRVGGYDDVDIERIIRLEPDIVIAWQSGNKRAQIDKLRQLNIPVFLSEPRTLGDIATTLRLFGELAGTEGPAEGAARTFERRLEQLREANANAKPLRAFYQVWNQPVITINGEHLISDAMGVCGIQNIFAELELLAPTISYEAVLRKDPQMIIASGMGEERPEWLHDWRRWPRLTAVKADNLFFVPPDLIQRHTPRIIQGIQRLCRQANQARENIKALKLRE